MMNGNGLSASDVALLSGSNNRGYNNGGFGGDWGAWIILFLIFGMFGWGGFGGGFGGFGGGFGGGAYPTEAILQRSLDTQSIIGKLDGITNGICDSTTTVIGAVNGLGMNVMQGFHGVDNAICNLGYQTQQGFNNTNIALMQGQNALQSQLASCCCETQRAIDGVNYNMATNTCAITNQMNANTRDIIDSQNAGTRAILDYLCQDKISTLQNEVQSLRLAASQANQNAAIGAMINASEANIIRRTGNDCPIPAYFVPNPNCCYGTPTLNYNNGCGCNSGCGCA